MGIKLTKEDFIRKSEEVHGNDYDYAKVDYINALSKVIIYCKKHDLEFNQTPAKHMGGQGCIKCKGEKLKGHFSSDLKTFIEKAKRVHGDTYEYDKVDYVNSKTEISIKCKKHGEYFLKSPSKHLAGQGCQLCSREAQSRSSMRPVENTIELSRSIHGDRYDYSKVIPTDCRSKVTVVCRNPLHGAFEVMMCNHIDNRSGCPKCSHIISNAQEEMYSYIKNIRPEAVSNKKLKDNTELDVYIEKLGMAFEYNGLYWHGEDRKSPGYHLKKTLQAESEGIRLIHIWEDEWVKDKTKTKLFISNLLGATSLKLNARQTVVRNVSWADCEIFLKAHHIQGTCAPTSMCIGLYSQDSLVSVMCFTTSTVKDGEVELIRFCSTGVVRGGFGKLLTYFIKSSDYASIVSFSDKRWSQGKIYESFGFDKEGSTPPSYWWCKGINRYHRRGFQHKYLASKLKVYNPEISEAENCKANGYFKLWDCGKDKWVLKLK